MKGACVLHVESGRQTVARTRRREGLIDEAAVRHGRCEVRSDTESPCGRPTAVSIMGIQFCERCARQQEAYFALGEYTQAPRGGGTLMTNAMRWQRPFHARLLRSLR